MTDKELRKLSRLELLELLLDVSQQNRVLEEKVKKLTVENENAKSIENLAVTTRQVNDMLGYAAALTGSVKTDGEVIRARVQPVTIATSNPVSKKQTDKSVLARLIDFYEENDSALENLPDELKKEITDRISSRKN